MPNIIAKTYIKEDADLVFKVIAKMDSFAHFISGVREVKILSESSTKRISEWQIDIQGTIVGWQEEQIINPGSRAIYFRMLDGDYGEYEGEWKVAALESGCKVELKFDIEWETEIQDEFLSKVLEKKARLAARWALREIRKKIGIGKTLSSSSLISYNKLISEPIEFKNFKGQRIVGFFDHLEGADKSKPFLVLMPGYGESKREMLYISYYLAKNNFNVIRYDASDHVGESDGNIFNTTMSKLKDDLLAAIDMITKSYKCQGVGVVASSLSLRAAIKAASEDVRISLLIGLVGVVNLQQTLLNIYQEDIIDDVQNGKIKNVYEVLGFEIDKQFPIQAVSHRYHDLDSSISDISKIGAPFILFQAEKDLWVSLEDSEKAINSSSNQFSQLISIPNSMHYLMENPSNFKACLKKIVIIASKYLKFKNMLMDDVAEPSKRELALQNKIEKERLRLVSSYSQDEEKQFWDHYLTKFTVLHKVPDYNQYLRTLVEALNINNDSVKILDVGCGNGYLGATLISNFDCLNPSGSNLNQNNSIKHSFDYYGVDRSQSVLEMAKKGHQAILHHRFSAVSLNGILPKFHYSQADLNKELPFENNYFDRICASLLLSYLESPVRALSEFLRVLKPGGVLIVSSMKPSADMSQIYRNFTSVCKNEDDRLLAKELLNEAGKIKKREGEGHYHFFSDKELKTLLFGAKVQNIKFLRTFGDQAVLVYGMKRKNKELTTK